MFSDSRKKKSSTDYSKEQNKIAQGTKIIGDIIAKGACRIEGTLEGTLKTPSKVVVGKTGQINGKVECGNADFEGKFSGILIVSETLSLRETAIIDGEVSANKLAIEPGATFNATCTMKGGVKSLNEASQNGRQEKAQKEEQSA